MRSLPTSIIGTVLSTSIGTSWCCPVTPAFLPAATAACPKKIDPPTSSRRCIMSSSSPSSSAQIEVEEKFALPADGKWSAVENKLSQLGFVPKNGGPVKFTDTYYDLAAPDWYLTPRDCWLRFRGRRSNGDDSSTNWQGKWQLKIRRRNVDDVGAATAYDEIEGYKALERVSELMADNVPVNEKRDNGEGKLFEDAPEGPNGLIPFAQFETSRSSWSLRDDDKSSSEYVGLAVDIDATDFGYGVGEVEAILTKEDDMADARKRIGKLVARISGEKSNENDCASASSKLPPLGKLETYLIDRRRDHYDAIIAAGIFKSV